MHLRFDASAGGAEIKLYELPDEVVLSLASLFVGCPLSRTDDYSSIDYLRNMRDWLRERAQTACFVCFLDTTTWLELHYQGDYVGTFCVEEQKFYRSQNLLEQKLAQHTGRVEMALLPPGFEDGDEQAGSALPG